MAQARDLARQRALIIDDNAVSRMVVTQALSMCGIGQVHVCSSLRQARRHLVAGEYDIILCDYHFDDTGFTGQDFFEELRRERALRFATAFVMITGEARYEKVAEVAESAPDDYLIKPFPPSLLLERLSAIWARKDLLLPLHDALERGDHDTALQRALQLAADNPQARNAALRIAAEILVERGEVEEARRIYEQVAASGAVPWARLGIARIDCGSDPPAARRTLETLVCSHPSYVDAYDLLGRMLLDAAQPLEAMAVFERAVRVTPANVERLQKSGTLGFFFGDPQDAVRALEKAVRIGYGTPALDLQTVLLLALLKYDVARDSRELVRLRAMVDAARKRNPASFRIASFDVMVEVLLLLAQRNIVRAVERLRASIERIAQPEFDFELACDQLALLSRVSQREIELPEAAEWARAIALRYCVSKTALELLTASCRVHEPYRTLVAEAYATIGRLANEAVNLNLNRQPAAAGELLLEQARRTGNARLLQLAVSICGRAIGDPQAARIQQEAEALAASFCGTGTHVSLGATGLVGGGAHAPAHRAGAMAASN